ncbi:MAG: hypothetical protein IKE22_13320, partial [Atopobiaceae bacterium]|nr:hypothetical protein [Atopobiaceae bacterium]
MDKNYDIRNERGNERSASPTSSDRIEERDEQQPHDASAAQQARTVTPVVIMPDAQNGPDQQQGQHIPSTEQPRKNPHTLLKVVITLIVGFITVNAVIALVSLSLLSLGVASCVGSCSDSPVGDSREVTAFISDRKATDRDLEVFDALRGCVEAVHDARARTASSSSPTDDEEPASLISVDELRAMVAAGTWPDESAGYGDVDDPCSPQLWVRIAELSQDYLEEETGETWDVVDFAYPFPDNGPIPAPPKRTETSSIHTRLVCRSGQDAGLFADVTYWRWEQPARFEERVGEAREQRDGILASLQALETHDDLAGRQFLYSGRDLYVWDQGENDPLRDPDAFVAFVNSVGDTLGAYTSVTLLMGDTPVMLAYNPLSYDYPNTRETQLVSLDTCRAMLTSGGTAFSLDYATADVLLSAYWSKDNPCELDDLRGTLAPDTSLGYKDRWMAPDEASVDDAVADAALPYLRIAGPDEVLALSERKEKAYETSGDGTIWAYVIVPRGALPEDADGFCTAANELRDGLWQELATTLGPDDWHRSLYLRLYVIDTDTIARDGDPRTFAELCTDARQDPTCLDSYTF